MTSRVERYRDQHVTHALNEIVRLIGHPLDTRVGIDEVRRALDNLYTNGAGWGEQDGYREAVDEARDRAAQW